LIFSLEKRRISSANVVPHDWPFSPPRQWNWRRDGSVEKWNYFVRVLHDCKWWEPGQAQLKRSVEVPLHYNLLGLCNHEDRISQFQDLSEALLCFKMESHMPGHFLKADRSNTVSLVHRALFFE
jgi:hypothetical protein